jgi:VanZ family protein
MGCYAQPLTPAAGLRRLTTPGALQLSWALAVAVVVTGSVLPGDSAALRLLATLNLSDKVEHFAAYGLLLFLPGLHEKASGLVAHALGAVSLGIILEFIQLLCPGRSFELGDMAADAAGVCCGLAAGLMLRAWLRRKTQPPFWNAEASSNTLLKNSLALGDGPM